MHGDVFRKDNRWLLPEGIHEVLPPRAQQLEQLRRELLDLFRGWGYELVMPPFIEFLDSLLTGTGHDLDLQTFKLTDQLSGRLMGVRADMTPQAARIDAHQLKRDEPVRLCYVGTVLRTRPDGINGSRDLLQVGAELFGYAGVEADIEIIELMVRSVRAARIDAIHLDLGHVGIYRGLVRQAGLPGEAEARLFDALQRKAVPEIESLLAELAVVEPVRSMLAALPQLHGGVEVLDQAGKVLAAATPEVLGALKDLWGIAAALERRMPEVPLHFDLAELRGYQYHTGAVFAAFSPGYGRELARGGRYDQIGKVFGRSRPATGFSADLKTLAALGLGAVVPSASGILADWSDEPEAVAEVERLRAQGERVVWALPGQSGDARAMGCDRRLTRVDGQWTLVPV